MVEAVVDKEYSTEFMVRTIAFGLTEGVLAAAIIFAIELMWQTFDSKITWSFDAFMVQTALVFLAVALNSGAMYSITMRNMGNLKHLFIGDLIAGAAMGAIIYVIMLVTTVLYSSTMIDLGFTGAHETGLAYYIPTILGPLLLLTAAGAIVTSIGAITCRTVVIKRRPTGNDMKNAARSTILLLAFIMVAPPLFAVALTAF